MSNLQSYAYPGVGELARKEMSFSQAVRVGDIIHVSGQGGYDRTSAAISADVNTEIDQAFGNVEHTLQHAGGKGWSQVYRVRTYSTDLKTTEARLVENFRKYMPDHYPVWTAVIVTKLGLDDMHFEIEVEAYDPEGAAEAKTGKKI
ncbi:YjgF-like protein [Xylariaceae sp. FL1651]|nr:YjgF-like protein [Xylariaceae sp. FL1651]